MLSQLQLNRLLKGLDQRGAQNQKSRLVISQVTTRENHPDYSYGKIRAALASGSNQRQVSLNKLDGTKKFLWSVSGFGWGAGGGNF